MRATWIGVQGAEPDLVLAALGLEPVPDAPADYVFSGDFACRTFPGGWFVVTSIQGLDLADDLATAAATTDQMAVGCEMSTIVMWSEAHGYNGGQFQWSVTHNPDDEARPLAVEGAQPAILANFVALAIKAQADEDDVDYVFEVPMKLVGHYTGFVYNDEEAPPDWVILRSARPERRSDRRPHRRKRPRPLLWFLLFIVVAAVLIRLFIVGAAEFIRVLQAII